MIVLPSYRILVAACVALLICSTPSFSAPESHTNRDYETAITKAMFSLETNDLSSAVNFFKKALETKPGDKAASIGLSSTYSKIGDYKGAKEALLKALAVDPADARIRYEFGIVMYKLNEPEEAKDFFTSVIESRADEALTTGARRYLDIIAGKGAGEKKGLSIGLLGGLQYDTNVILEPDNPASTQQRQTDWRGVLSLDSAYRFLKSETTTADVGYQFYQSVHHTLHDFNIQQHSLKLAGTYDLSSTAKAGLKYTYSYTLAGGARFSTLNETIPYVTVAFSPASLTEFHFICDKERFRNGTLFPLNAEQSGTDRTIGFLHTIRVSASTSVNVGYDFDAEDANVDAWSYQGNKGQIGFRTTSGHYTATASASYYDRRYKEPAPGISLSKRHDGVQEYSLDVSRSIAKDLNLSLSDLYTVNDSNLPAYTYTRNVLGIFVVTRL